MRAAVMAIIVGITLSATSSAAATGTDGWVEYRRAVVKPNEVVQIVLDDTAVLESGDTAILRSWDGRSIWLILPDSSSRTFIFRRESLGPLELFVEAGAKGTAKPSSYPAPDVSRPLFSSPSPADVERPASAFPALMAVPLSPVSVVTQTASPSLSTSGASAGLRSPVPPITLPPPPLVLATPPGSRGSVLTTSGSGFGSTAQSGVRSASPVTQAPPVPASPPVTVIPYARTESAPSGARLAPDRNSVDPRSPLPDVAGPVPSSVIERAVPRGSTMQVDTASISMALAKPGELALFELATDLLTRGLHGDAVLQYRRFMSEYPRSGLKEIVMINIGESHRRRAEQSEKESLRQRDLRRSGAATEAIDAAVSDFAAAVTAYREFQNQFPKSPNVPIVQLAVAQSVHGQVRAYFQKGGQPQDSPAVVVEYLRAYVGLRDTSASPSARLGIAQYYRDLGDARLAAQAERSSIREAYMRAVEEFTGLVAAYPSHPEAAEALVDVARLYDRNLEMRHFSEAVRYYEMILLKYPASPFAEEAKARARWIRENYL